ncbi:PAS domain-containing sensor histidine kinase [Pedobacter sp.]|uniref:PAS domain-containing sensor histidine kinase n=1 Tax=Pedobacter sp. TaxID=1411316 RepID=UPI003C386F76
MKANSNIFELLSERSSRMCFMVQVPGEKIIYSNSAFMNFFEGIDEGASIEKLFALVHPEDVEYIRSSYQTIQDSPEAGCFEFRVILSQKTYFLRVDLAFDKTMPNKKLVIGYIEDRTIEKKHVDYLQEFANKKNATLSILSHDLAGPLGVIQMMSDMLLSRTSDVDDAKIIKMLDLISRSAKKGISMIQDMIRKEFLESIGVEMVKSRVNLIEKINQLLEEYKQGELMVNVSFSLEASLEEVFVEIDESKFIQIINNLVSNSLKFTPDGGKITIGVVPSTETVTISVSDTGIGIPKQFHAQLFEKFNPAGRTGLKGEPSVGLGMSVIKTIVEWHSGKIWFETEVGIGTTFFIEIKKSK